MSDTSIKGLMQKCVGQETTLLTGKVTSANPISVKIQDDSGLTLGSALLIVPEHLKEKKTDITISGEKVTITINEALAVGDMVTVLAVNRGSLYYILGRN